MDGVHSSSFKNIVQGESVGVRPGNDKGDFGGLAGLVCLTSVDFWHYQPAALYQLGPRGGIHRKLLIMFSLGLWDIMTFSLFSSFVLMVTV